jgi:hypothetical protein
LGWTGNVLEMIDLRSFSNLWYWIMLAVLWSVTSHWVLGVPYDMIARARRMRGQAEDDLRDLVRINATRLVALSDGAGHMLPALVFFVLTVLVLLGFAYGIEFAQAVLLMLAPMSLVLALSLRAARRALALLPDTPPLYGLLWRHRLACQAIGVVSIFVTAMWGMWQNLNIGAFGAVFGH